MTNEELDGYVEATLAFLRLEDSNSRRCEWFDHVEALFAEMRWEHDTADRVYGEFVRRVHARWPSSDGPSAVGAR